MTTPTKTTLVLTSLRRTGPVTVNAYMIGKHWAISEKYARDGWALTHTGSGAVDGRGHWDEATACALAARVAVPGYLDEPELPSVESMRPWCDEVAEEGNALQLATAGTRLAPKMDGLRLFRVEIEQTREATVYVLAKSTEEAEAMSREVEVSWGEEDYSEHGIETDATSIPSNALNDDIVAPKGFPSTSVREVLAALAAREAAEVTP